MDEHDVTLGDHRMCLGDCLDVLPTLAAASVDLVVADLPYNITANPWDSAVPLPDLWRELQRVGAPTCVYVFTATMRFALSLINSNPKIFRYDLVWDKGHGTGFGHVKTRPLRSHEHILVFGSTSQYFPQMQKSERPRVPKPVATSHRTSNLGVRRHGMLGGDSIPWVDNGYRYPVTVQRFARHKTSRGDGHPTQKPVDLLSWLLRTYSSSGDTVLDPTAGLFSTAVAAERTGRRSIGIERDADYFARGTRRVRDELAGVAPQPKRPRKPPPAAQRALWSVD